MNDHRVTWITLVLLLLVSFSAPALSQSSEGNATIENVTYAGDAAIETDADEILVWRAGPHQFAVTVSSESGLDGGSLCLWTGPSDETSESELACQSLSVQAETSKSVTLEFDAWPANTNGRHTVRVVARSADERQLDEFSTDRTVLERDGDVDQDGLANERETVLGTDLRVNDTDEDGLEDGVEVHTYGTDPTSNDTDGDGLLDREEIRTYQTNPTAEDTDDDGLNDTREVSNETDPNVADTDGDDLDDALEINTYGTNATVADTDGDGLGDGAEVDTHGTNPTKQDTDGDGLTDNLEVHTYGTDPNAIDSDDDGLKDGNEVHEYRTDPAASDSDEDGLSDGEEVNVYQTNPNKADTDGDGLADGAEVNQFETDPNAADTDGDGVSDREEVKTSETTYLMDPALLAAVGAVLVLGGGIFVFRSERPLSEVVHGMFLDTRPLLGSSDDQQSATESVEESTDERSSPGVESQTSTVRDDAIDPVSERSGNSDDTDATEPEEIDLDLLPNSECVLAVLDENGGQIRQSELVEETGWSKAKVSRVLSKMEADDEIVKVSVGRGNLITTPDDVPSGVRSPFED